MIVSDREQYWGRAPTDLWITNPWVMLFLFVAGISGLIIVDAYFSVPLLFGFTQLVVLVLILPAMAWRFATVFVVLPIWGCTLAIVSADIPNLARALPELPRTAPALGMIVLVLYWLIIALVRTATGNRDDDEGWWAALWIGLSLWGLTLQLATIFAVLVLPYFERELHMLPLGADFIRIVETIRLTSPFAWVPTGVFLLGVSIVAILAAAGQRYRPISPDKILRVRADHVLLPVVSLIRLPLWIALVIGGALAHFAALLLRTFGRVIRGWMARMTLLLFGLVFPSLNFVGGHYSALAASETIERYRTFHGDWLQQVTYVGITWGEWILMLSLYLVAAVLCHCPAKAMHLRQAWSAASDFVRGEGKSLTNGVVLNYVVLGPFGMCLPIAAAFRGSLGAYSIVYLVIAAALVLVVYLWNQTPWAGAEE
jgi:hypothetical protein